MMEEFKAYILSGDASLLPSEKALGRIVDRYPWFVAARAALDRQRGAITSLLSLSLTGRPAPAIFLRSAGREEVVVGSTMEIIDSFLCVGEHRIVPTDAATDADMSVAASMIVDEDLTEEIAEIYLAQGHKRLALEAYNKLCLLYPKKNVYFAQIIACLEHEAEAQNDYKTE